MKKALMVLAVAGFFAACNNSGSTSEAQKADSSALAAPATISADSTSHLADSTKTADSSALKQDTSVKK